jgi:hypothetical protein
MRATVIARFGAFLHLKNCLPYWRERSVDFWLGSIKVFEQVYRSFYNG